MDCLKQINFVQSCKRPSSLEIRKSFPIKSFPAILVHVYYGIIHVHIHVSIIAYWAVCRVELEVLRGEMPASFSTTPLQSIHSVVTKAIQL